MNNIYGADPFVLTGESLLDNDWYKFTMAQYIWRYHRDVRVKFRFISRSGDAFFNDVFAVEVAEHLDIHKRLRFTEEELFYLASLQAGGRSVFEPEFINFLRTVALPDFVLEKRNGKWVLEFSGPWSIVLFWEVPALAIVNGLRNLKMLHEAHYCDLDPLEYGCRALEEKSKAFERAGIRCVVDNGTRRRHSFTMHERVFQHMPWMTTTNVLLSKRNGTFPAGTMAHELFMVSAGLCEPDEEAIRASQNRVFDQWAAMYPYELRLALPDTFGTDFFFATFGERRAHDWMGTRQDSGIPKAYGERGINWYKSMGIDPRDKKIVFSDGLSLQPILDLYADFSDRIQVGFGWGTLLTNDCGLPPASLVAKPVEANGVPLVKLSDNLTKATGRKDDINRYIRIFGYNGTETAPCIV